MENNDTLSSASEEKEYVPPKLIALMRTVSSVIIILNVTVLICLVKGRRTFPNAYWYQIMCITCNDLLAGISSFAMSFVDWPFFGEYIAACSMTVGLFFITQCATLYNILAICISRFVMLKGLKQRENPWKKVHTMYGTVAAWTVSSLLCSTPFIIWSDAAYFSRLRFCSMKGIFDDHVSSAMKILLGSFLIPLVLTDVIYSLVFVVLKKDLKILPATASLGPALSITSIQMESRMNSPRRLSSENELQDDEKKTYRCQGVQTEVSMSTCGLSRGFKSVPCDNLQTCQSLTNTSHLENSDSGEESTKNCCKKKTVNEHFDYRNEFQLTEQLVNKLMKRPRRNKHNITVPILRIHKAFVLLGLILIALNIFTWPGLIALLLGSMLDSSHFSRSLILPLFSTLALNSLVNPILYTVRVPEFRASFNGTFLSPWYKRKHDSRRSLDTYNHIT